MSDYQLMIESSLEGLYLVDLGFTFCVCNIFGYCVFHGSKKMCDEFISSYNSQLSLFKE